MFGWVQAIMQLCSVMPSEPPEQYLRRSPLIYKIEVAVAEKDAR